MRRIVITTGAVVVVLATALAGASTTLADEPPATNLEIGYPPPCGDAAAATARADTALVAAEGPEALRKNCRLNAEVSMYTAADWNRLAQHLAAEASHCADYTISIPAIAGNKTQPRPDQAW